MSDDPKDNILWHQSGVNRAGEPFIQLILNDKVVAQQSVQQARDHALAILEACEAAEQDAFLCDWLKQVVGADENACAGLLKDFRLWRERMTGKRSGQEVIPENGCTCGQKPHRIYCPLGFPNYFKGHPPEPHP